MVFRQPTMIEAIEGAIKSVSVKMRVTISENRQDAFYDATCINIAGQYCLVTFQDRSDQEQIQQMRRISWPMFPTNLKAHWLH